MEGGSGGQPRLPSSIAVSRLASDLPAIRTAHCPLPTAAYCLLPMFDFEPLPSITREFVLVNRIEAGFWIVLGIGFAAGVLRTRDVSRRLCAIASVTLVIFGLSDVAETQTGAWWHPWWLLAWKGLCVLALAALVALFVRLRRAE